MARGMLLFDVRRCRRLMLAAMLLMGSVVLLFLFLPCLVDLLLLGPALTVVDGAVVVGFFSSVEFSFVRVSCAAVLRHAAVVSPPPPSPSGEAAQCPGLFPGRLAVGEMV